MTHGCIVTPRPICHFMSMHIKLAGLRNPKRVTLSGALGEVFRAARLPNPAKIVSAQSNHVDPSDTCRHHHHQTQTTTHHSLCQLICCLNEMTTVLRPIPSALVQVACSRLMLPIRSRFTVPHTLLSRPFSYDHVVIGAGVVGLAVAAKLAE